MAKDEIIEQGQALDEASKALILLHGRGAMAHDILTLASYFDDGHFYMAAPQAPNQAWYPQSFMAEEHLNEPWLTRSVEIVKNLMDQVSNFIPKNRIYLMGFSQGACLALEVSTRFATKYGGIVAFTGGLIGSTINEKKYHGNFEGTKVFIGNSDRDPHVPLIRSEQSKAFMEKMGANVTLKIYKGMAHTINGDEINSAKELFFSIF